MGLVGGASFESRGAVDWWSVAKVEPKTVCNREKGTHESCVSAQAQKGSGGIRKKTIQNKRTNTGKVCFGKKEGE